MPNIYKLVAMLYFIHLPYTLGQQWVSANGPMGLEGVNDIIIDPDGSVYAATVTGGVYKSTNEGEDWVKTGLGNKSVLSLLYHHDLLLAGTTVGLYQSTDEGESWSYFGVSNRINIIKTGPNDWIYVGTNVGVYISTNNGQSWTQSNNGLTDFGKPVNYIFFKDNYVFLCAQKDVYRSDDWGINWYQVLLTNSANSMDIAQNGDLYCSSYNYLYKSTNDGDNWSIASFHSGYSKIKFYGDSLVIGFIGGNSSGLQFTTDFGVNWTRIGFQDTSIASFYFINNTYYVGSKSFGIFISKDSLPWINRVVMGSKPVKTKSILVLPDGKIIAATEQWGISYSTNFGVEWKFSSQNTGDFNQLAYTSKGIIFAQSPNKIWRSTDEGKFWEVILNHNGTGDFGRISVDYLDNIYVGSRSLFVSEDYGNSWSVLRYISSNFGFLETVRIDDSILFSQTLEIIFYSGHWILWRSTDNGSSWSINFDHITFNTLKTDSQRKYIIGCSNSLNKLFMTSDKGENWTNMNKPPGSLRSFILNNRDELFAHSNGGVYKSSDLGKNWEQIANYLSEIYKLDSYKDSLLFAATGGGVFFTDQNVTPSIVNEYKTPTFMISQNYPNPFNPVTNIRYSIAEYSRIAIKIFDILGSEIITLVNTEQPAGTYEITWDASGCPSGTYFYQIRAGDYTSTNKMMLIR